jgi:hypothetical protein
MYVLPCRTTAIVHSNFNSASIFRKSFIRETDIALQGTMAREMTFLKRRATVVLSHANKTRAPKCAASGKLRTRSREIAEMRHRTEKPLRRGHC